LYELIQRIVFITSAVVLFLPTGKAEQSALSGLRSKLESGKEHVRIVCLGDSITGVYYHTGNRRAWPDMLGVAIKRTYPDAQLTIVNSGRSGDNTSGGIHRFERDVLAHHPDLVIVMFGMNDIVHTPMVQFQENLVEMVKLARRSDAAVVVCTPNSIDDAEAENGRSNQKLAKCAEVIQQIGRSEQVPVANCYEVFERLCAQESRNWQLLFSDSIHPNMDGHKQIAKEVAATIAGKPVTQEDVGPPIPAMPKTNRLLAAGKPVKVLAMPPYDTLLVASLQHRYPESQIDVSTWRTKAESLTDLVTTARQLRDKEFDLIAVAVPWNVSWRDGDQLRQLYLKLMNELLTPGPQKWDVVAFAPSLASSDFTDQAKGIDALLRQLIRGQDIATLTRDATDATPVAELLTRWIEEQASSTSDNNALNP
jgi:lysophospholipase L1-like esterase